MTEKQTRKSPQRKDEEDGSASPDRPKQEKQASETTAITEDVLDDIDRALKAACDFDDKETVSNDEFTARAYEFVKNYQQKGGQ